MCFTWEDWAFPSLRLSILAGKVTELCPSPRDLDVLNPAMRLLDSPSCLVTFRVAGKTKGAQHQECAASVRF